MASEHPRKDGSDSDEHANTGEGHVLPNGAEIHFTDERDAHSADRVEFLPGGHVKAVYKNQYQLEVYPPHVIEGVYTFTKHLEDEEWW